MFDFQGILSLDAVKSISNTPYHTLLTLTSTGDLAGYTTWHAGHGSELASLGLSHDALVTKLRLITLATMSSSGAVLSFAQIASTLNIDANNVEDWVIDGELRGLVGQCMIGMWCMWMFIQYGEG